MNVLDEIAAFANVTINGESPVVTRMSRAHLARLFRILGYRTGVEVGTWQGAYAEQLCQHNPGVSLRCVDPWVQYKFYNEKKNNQDRMTSAYLEACERLKPYGCIIDRRTSKAAAKDVPDGSLDFVYIDGNHAKAYVLEDLHAWCPKVRRGGIVSGHDYGTKQRHAVIEVKDAVDEYLAAHKIATWFLVPRDKSASYFWVQP